jgi:tetratricopeptide (TPR) repeat protein
MNKPVAEPESQADLSLPLALTFDGGRCLLHSTRQKHLGPAQLVELRLEVTDLKFPFDIDGGAQQFRHRRCLLDSVTLAVEEDVLRLWLIERLGPLGLELDSLSYRRGVLELIGSYEEPGSIVDFVIRGFVRASSEEVRICLCDANLYGTSTKAGPQLVHQLLSQLKTKASPTPPGLPAKTKLVGLTDLVVSPLWQILRSALPAAGWRLPETEGSRLSKTQRHPGRLQFSYQHVSAQESRPDAIISADHQRFAAFQESKDLFANLETELARVHVDDALLLLRAEMAQQPRHPFLMTRALQFLAADSTRAEETLELAQLATEQFDDFMPAFLAIAAVAERRFDWAAAIDAYTHAAEIAERRRDRREEVRALLSAARVARAEFPQLAQKALEKVIELDASNPTALDHLAALSGETGEWHRLVEIRQRQIRSAQDDTQRIALRMNAAETLRTELGELENARHHYEACLAINPQWEPALLGLAESYATEGKWSSAIVFFDRLVSLARVSGNAELEATYHLQISILREQEGQIANALSRSEQASLVAPTNDAALRRSADLFIRMEDFARAENALRRLLLLCRSPQRRMRIHIELARLYAGPLGNNQGATAEVRKALLVSPSSTEALDLFVQLGEDRGDRDDLISSLKMAAASELDHERRGRFLLRLGKLLAKDAGQHGEAIEALQSAIACSFEIKSAALTELAKIHFRSQRWDDACRCIEGLGPQRSAPQWLLLAESKFKKGEPSNALEGTRAGLELALRNSEQPTRRRLLMLLVDIYAMLEDPMACIEPLEELLEDSPETSEERIAFLAQLADHKRAVKDLEGALKSAEESVALRPDKPSAIDQLAGIYEQLHRYGDAQELLDRRLSKTPLQPAGERGNLLMRLANLAASQERFRDGIEYLRQALREGVTGQMAQRCQQGIIRLHLRREDAEAAGAAAESWARAADGHAAADHWVQAGDLWRKEANDQKRAARCFQEALENAPTHAAALDALEAYYSSINDGKQLVSILRQKIEATAEQSARRCVLLVRLAERLEEQGDRSEALKRANEALDIDKNQLAALDFLGQLAWQSEDWQGAGEYYERLDQSWGLNADDKNLRLTQIALWVRRAQLAQREGKRDAEEELLHRCLERDPRHKEAMASLKTLLQEMERHKELAELLASEAEKAGPQEK